MSEIKQPMIFARDYIHMLRDKGFDISEHDRVKLEKYLKQYTEHMVQQKRTTIKDIAPNGVTGGMFAITKKSVNGKNKFPVVSVHFEHDLVALNDFDDEDEPTWYRTEDIIEIINN